MQRNATTTANKATPSIRAAATIMFVKILLITSGCLAIASIACPPMRPIPIPAPIAARPAPTPAPNFATPAAAACNNNAEIIIVNF